MNIDDYVYIDGMSMSSSDVDCNDTCCTFLNSQGMQTVFCFIDYDFPKNLTSPPPWELGLRWGYTTLVTLVAVFGNISLILILTRNRLLLKTSVNLFILNMSIADLITALAGPIPFTIRDTNDFWVLGQTWCYLEGYIQMLVMLVSVTSLAVISYDRMIGVVYPFHQHLKTWQSTMIIIVIWGASAGISVPFAIFRVYTVHEWSDLTELTCEEISYKIQIWWIIVSIALVWLPLLTMVAAYTVIFVSLKRYSSMVQGPEHPAILHLKRRVVRMMFIVVIVFIVCWTPFLIFQLFQGSISENGQLLGHQQLYGHLLTVSQYMIYLNMAVNPIIYGLLHQTFRRAFRVTFSCFFRSKKLFVLTPRDGTRGFVWSLRSHTGRSGSCALSRSIINHSTGPGVELHRDEKKHRPPSFKDEEFVKNLQGRKKTFLTSGGALGHLINEVIEEENTSDLDSERLL